MRGNNIVKEKKNLSGKTVFFIISNKNELTRLLPYLNDPFIKGLYLKYSLFLTRNIQKMNKILRIIYNLGKRIFLDCQIHKFRPELFERRAEKPQKSIQKRRGILKFDDVFKINNKKINFDDLLDLDLSYKLVKVVIEKQLNIYKKIAVYKGQKTLLISPNIQGAKFEGIILPYMPWPVQNGKKRIREIRDKCREINQNFITSSIELIKDYQDLKFYYTIPFNKDDINTDFLKDLIKKAKNFNETIMWIVDYNELRESKRDILEIKKFMNEIKSKINKVTLKIVGIYHSQCFNKNIEKFILRTNGYPGFHINIPAQAKRTKRIYHPNLHYCINLENLRVFESHEIEWSCNCQICNILGIYNIREAYKRFSLDNAKIDKYLKIHNFLSFTSDLKIDKMTFYRNIRNYNEALKYEKSYSDKVLNNWLKICKAGNENATI